MSKDCCECTRDTQTCQALLNRMRQPIATILGSGATRVAPSFQQEFHALSQKTVEMGQLLVRRGYSILTGGGPGLMDAANKGATEQAHKDGIEECVSGAIRVKGIDEAFACPSCQDNVMVNTFEIRKHFLLAYCKSCFVLPGGVGTTDELWHLLNYMKHEQTTCEKVFLVDTAFWRAQNDWLATITQTGLAGPNVIEKVFLTDFSDLAE